jgi:hypothetical protein
MSELTNARCGHAGFRRQLMIGASVAALAASIYAPAIAVADDDTDRPTIWIELGGQLERLDDSVTPFAPSFFDTITSNGFKSPLEAGKRAIYSNGAEAQLSFAPEDSNWTFSGSVRYGRSNGDRVLHQQPKGQVTRFYFVNKYITKTAAARYAETKSKNAESHFIADFQAGKDVGLGMFGRDGASTINFGLRFAQFSEKWNATIRARPDVHLMPEEVAAGKYVPLTFYHQYFASAQRSAAFHGLGPSISWNASAQIEGDKHAGGIAFDWGMNAAVLFGRQKTRTHHQSSGSYHYYSADFKYRVVKQLAPRHGTGDRSHSVIVPNVGGFAGLSYNFPNAKVSVGYRGDFFFDAMDGGIDAAKKETRGFYGPFANISIGLGG